jgi:WD40 repeat protein
MLLYGEGMYAGGGSGSSEGGGADNSQPHVYVQPLVRGHHGKILRIAAHPTEPVFATISTDRTLRLWNSQRKEQIALTRLAERASAVAFTPDGSSLAIGNENGEVMIVKYIALDSDKMQGMQSLQGEELELGGVIAGNGGMHEKQWQVILRRHVAAKPGQPTPGSKAGGGSGAPSSSNSAPPVAINRKRSEVTELKFSPDGDVLAVGCRDNLIHLLSVHNGYKRAAVCRGHNSYIRNFDFSADGRVLQATDAVRELRFWEVSTGKQIANAAHTRDVAWATGKCCLGWHVQGIFNGPAGVPIDGEMNAVCRSKNRSLLVAGGSNTVNNAVKLFRYPCVSKSIPSLHGGHTSPVLDVMFLAEDSDVVTVGGSDSTIFTWSIVHERGSSRGN